MQSAAEQAPVPSSLLSRTLAPPKEESSDESTIISSQTSTLTRNNQGKDNCSCVSISCMWANGHRSAT